MTLVSWLRKTLRALRRGVEDRLEGPVPARLRRKKQKTEIALNEPR